MTDHSHSSADNGADFDAWFRKFNKWDVSHDQLLSFAFTPGDDKGDIVWTNPNGSHMTRHICSGWIEFYGAAKAGWNARGLNLNEPQPPQQSGLKRALELLEKLQVVGDAQVYRLASEAHQMLTLSLPRPESK